MKVVSIVLAVIGGLALLVAAYVAAGLFFPRDSASIETWGVAFEILAAGTALVGTLCLIAAGLTWRAYRRKHPFPE